MLSEQVRDSILGRVQPLKHRRVKTQMRNSKGSTHLENKVEENTSLQEMMKGRLQGGQAEHTISAEVQTSLCKQSGEFEGI